MTTAVLEKPIETEEVLQKVTVAENTVEQKELGIGKFEIIPLYRIEAVMNGWEYFTIGVEKVLEYTIGETNMITIQNDILAKELLMWIGRLDGKYQGFCTTRLYNFNNKGTIGGVKKYLDVIHLYIKKGTNPMCFFMALNQMKGIAKRIACNRVRMWTTREDWGNVLNKRGWKKGYQEYYLEVK